MPLYEYECAKCGTFEQMQRFSDPLLTVCPTCDGPVEKLVSAPAIQFKGSGWYITDYARKSSGKEGAKEGAGAKGDGKGGGEATDAGTGKDKAAAKDAGGSKDTSASSAKASDKK